MDTVSLLVFLTNLYSPLQRILSHHQPPRDVWQHVHLNRCLVNRAWPGDSVCHRVKDFYPPGNDHISPGEKDNHRLKTALEKDGKKDMLVPWRGTFSPINGSGKLPLMKGNKDWRDLWEGRVLLLILMSRKPGEVWVDGKREAFELRPEYPSMILKETHHGVIVLYLVVVSKIFYLHPYLWRWSNLTNIFQIGWNHQLV